MKKLKPEDLKELQDDIENLEVAHRDVIDDDQRIARPFKEFRDAVRIKYETVKES